MLNDVWFYTTLISSGFFLWSTLRQKEQRMLNGVVINPAMYDKFIRVISNASKSNSEYIVAMNAEKDGIIEVVFTEKKKGVADMTYIG